jgi:hypothetical protein
MALPRNKPISNKYAQTYLADVSTAGSAFASAPRRGRIVKVWSILYGPITGADAAVTVKINGTAVPGLALTIAQDGSAAGDVDSAENGSPIVAIVNPGDSIEFASDGASSTTAPAGFLAEIAWN